MSPISPADDPDSKSPAPSESSPTTSLPGSTTSSLSSSSTARPTRSLSTAISGALSRLGGRRRSVSVDHTLYPHPHPHPYPYPPPGMPASSSNSNSSGLLRSPPLLLPELPFPLSPMSQPAPSSMRASLVVVGKNRRSTTSTTSPVGREGGGWGEYGEILAAAGLGLHVGGNAPPTNARSLVAGDYGGGGGVFNGRAPSVKPVESRYAHLGEPPTFRIGAAEPVVGQEIWTEDAHYLLTPARSAIILKLPDEVWGNISGMLDSRDLSSLSRSSRVLRGTLDPHLYSAIKLSPRYPHNTSYLRLAHRMRSLLMRGNESKVRQHTKAFIVSSGWEENAFKLCDYADFLMTDDVRDESGVHQLVSPEQVVELMKEEGLEDDGGVREVNALVAEFLLRATGIVKIVWGSPIPMRVGLVANIATLTTLRRVDVNLAQPTRLQRSKGDWRVLEKAVLVKYRPPVGLLGVLPLTELKLANLPTRGGDWWVSVWGLIRKLRSLRVLKVEMPHINKERYPGLFNDKDCMVRDAVAKKVPPVWAGCVGGLEVLEIAGFVVFPATVSGVPRLSLKGCMRGEAGQGAYWPSQEYFCTTGWAFVDIGLQSITMTNPIIKELHLLQSNDQTYYPPTPPPAIAKATKQLFMVYLPVLSKTVRKLSVPPAWRFSPQEMASVVRACRDVTHLSLGVHDDLWPAFLQVLPSMRKLSEIHVANASYSKVRPIVNRLVEARAARVGMVVKVGNCAHRLALVKDVFGWRWRAEIHGRPATTP